MVSTVFQWLLLLSCIAIPTGIGMDMFDIIFFRTGVIALFMSALWDKPKRQLPEYLSNIILFLMVVCMANLFLHAFTPMVLHTQMNIFLACVGFNIAYCYWDTAKSLKKFLVWGALINIAVWGLQKAHFNPFFDQMPYPGQEGGLIGNQPRFVTYFALISPFLRTPLLAISIFLGLFTKQIIIFVPVVLTLFLRLKNWRYRSGLIILIFILTILLHKHIFDSLKFRVDLSYFPVLKEFFKRPLLGFGLGARPIPELEVVGNSYLQFIVGTGLAGAIWFWYLFKNLYKKLIFNTETIALISLGLIMLVEYPVEIPRMGFTIMAILIMAMVRGVKNDTILN